MFLSDYIKVYESAMPHDLCEEMIKKFDASPNAAEATKFKENGEQQSLEHSFLELTVSTDEDFKTINPVLMKIVELAVGKYQAEVPSKIFPEKVGCEMLRMRKYRAGTEDKFPYHVDVNNYASAKRFLSLVWYLNDVDTGGDTFFPHPNIRVKPRQSRLLMFPSVWMYPHMGEPSPKQDRYVLTTYLHYV